MDWLQVILKIGEKGLDIYKIKLIRKYKKKIKEVRDSLWEEENKPDGEQDHAILVNLKKEQKDLEELFYNEFSGALIHDENS